MKIAKNWLFFYLRSIAVVGCLVCLKATDGNFSVKIVSPTAGQIIQDRNQTVEFNCTVNSRVSDRDFQTFDWLRNSEVYNPGNVKNTPYWSSFEIQGLRTSEDEGTYICIYGNASDERTVRIASKPEIVVGWDKTTQSPHDTTVDDSPVLRCFAKGWPYPNLVWIKDEQDLNVSNKDHKYLIKKQDMNTITLEIIGIQKEDQGKYICKAENIIGAVNHSIYVLVEDILKPKIKAIHSVYSAETGTDATLICDGEDLKRLSSTDISWKFNGAEINSTSNHYDIADNYTDDIEASSKVRTVLTIFNFGHPDVGTYMCSVTTESSEASDSIVVTVKAKDSGKTGGLGRGVVAGAVVLSCVVLIALATAGFLIWRRNKKRRWMRAIAQKYDLVDQQFDKDVFVSYSSKDYDWVEQNLQPLFERHGIQYIIHSRDFTPGKAFVENMADSVYHSRKIILVVSLNYLNSGYCKEEMHMAVHRCVEKQDSSLILIRIDNITTKELPKNLRDRTFIDFTSKEETHTWEERVVEYVRSQVPPSVSEVSQETDYKVSLLSSFFRMKRKPGRNKPNLEEFDNKEV